ncbi:MAG: hypothetical protein R3B71_05855 [Candidatus Gracilibacteria bacterium]
MADNNPNNPDSQGEGKDENLNEDQKGSERAYTKAEQGRNLPLERDRLLEQIEENDENDEKDESGEVDKRSEDEQSQKKRRRRRRRRKKPKQENELDEGKTKEEEPKPEPERESQQEAVEETQEDEQPEVEKPKKKRRRRRRKKKKENVVADESSEKEDLKVEEVPEPEPEVEQLEPKVEPEVVSDLGEELESKAEAESEIQPESKPEPELTVEHAGFTGPDIEVESVDLPEPEPEVEAEPEPEVEAEPELEVEPEPEQEVELEPEPGVEPEPEPEVEPESELEPEVEPEPELEVEPESELEPEVELEPEPEIEPEPEPEPEVEPEPEPEPEVEPEPFGYPPESQFESEEPHEPEQEEDLTPISQPGFENPYDQHQEDSQGFDDQETFGKPTVSEAEIIPMGDEKIEVLPENGGPEVQQDHEIAESQEETPEEVQKKIDEKKAELGLEEGGLEEKKGIGESLRSVFAEVSPILGRVFNLRLFAGIAVIGIIVAGGWWSYSSNFFGLFDGDGGSNGGPTETSDQALMREYGLITGELFGMNDGSVYDRLSPSIRAADFFGTLSEPAISGETGISAASFYGELMDEREIDNQFIEYVRSLERLQNLYSIDVYGLLSQTTERESALTNYIQQLRDAYEDGTRTLAAIRLNIDDLTISFSSISGQKDTFEVDFFDALDNLEAERSDALLKSFVDVSQKQVALRARVAALERLVSFYEIALQKLDERRNAVESNVQALVQGVRVVEVPGAEELDLIIQP